MKITSPVILARAATVTLALIQSIAVIYTCIFDGSPFRKELLIPWMSTTLLDFYILIGLLVAWMWYKESTWTSRLIWTALFVCFGSITVMAYVAIEFFKLSTDDPVHNVLLKDRHNRWLSSTLLDPSYFNVGDEEST